MSCFTTFFLLIYLIPAECLYEKKSGLIANRYYQFSITKCVAYNSDLNLGQFHCTILSKLQNHQDKFSSAGPLVPCCSELLKDFLLYMNEPIGLMHQGRNHDSVIARRGIDSQGLREDKPLLALQGNSSLGFRSRTSGERFPLLMCLKIPYEITANAHVQLLSQ